MMPTILIVAHDPWFLQLMRMYIQECGFQAVQAYEGQDVLPMVREQKPSAVLLQSDLPGNVKGWDVLRALHNDLGTCRIPVLLFTGHNQTLPLDAREGVAVHLTEPVTFEMISEALQKLGLDPVSQNPGKPANRDRARSMPNAQD